MGIVEAIVYAVVIFVIVIAVLSVIALLIKVATLATEKIIGRYKK